MRADVLLIALAIVLLLTGIGCVILMRRTAQQLMTEAELAAALLPADPNSARAQLDELASHWQNALARWRYLVRHEDLFEASQALTDARESLLQGDAAAARMACLRLADLIDAMMEKELPTPDNLF